MEPTKESKKLLHPDMPLYLPDGSIRAIIAVGTTIIVLAMYGWGKTVPDDLLKIWLMVLTFYFAQRVGK
jgi:hypothetical protein